MAGKVSHNLNIWESLTSDGWILAQVRGIKIEFVNGFPSAQNSLREYKFSRIDREALQKELNRMEDKGIIKRVEPTDGQIISPIMFRRKSDNNVRCILNLADTINTLIAPEHFKMENINNAIRMIKKGSFFMKIDLTDAFYAFKIAEEHRKYFRFRHLGILWEYVGVPNGYGWMPYIFSKTMRVVLGLLRSWGINCVGYLDDFLFVAQNKIELQDNVSKALILFDRLGFTINTKKSILSPVQSIEFLGFLLDSCTMKIYPSKSRKEKIRLACQKSLTKRMISVRELSCIIGQLVAVSTAVKFGVVFYKRLEIRRNRALKQNNGNWEAKIKMGAVIKEDLQWWKSNINSVSKQLITKPFSLTIFSDASSKGWGGECNGEVATGIFTQEEIEKHINWLELLAAFFCLKSFVKTKGNHVKLYTDNITAMTCINKQGSTKRACNQLTRELCLWCMETNTKVTAVHIAGVLNKKADIESRLDKSGMEWQLNSSVFKKVNELYGPFIIDLFASRINNQLRRYVSWKGDPNAWAINALTLDWGKLKCLYAFPPFSLIQRCLQKIAEQKADVTLVVPLWRGQAWFSEMLRMLTDSPIVLPTKKSLLVHPQNRQLVHPLLPKMKLLVCRLSGKNSKVQAFRKNLPSSSCVHGGKIPKNIMALTTENGLTFVVENKLITFNHLNTLY